jgi:hypothetical protein
VGHDTLQVKDIVPNSQAVKLGVESGWRILKIGVDNIDSYTEFENVLGKLKSMKESSALFLFKIPDKYIDPAVLSNSKLLYFNMNLNEPLGLDLGHNSLEVKSVTSSSQASNLGIVPGCHVVKIGNDTVSNFKEFMASLNRLKNKGELKTLILLKMPDLNQFAYNKDFSKFRESVFQNEKELKKISIAGNLMKKGSNVMNPWQSRYFVAENHYLRYYKSE